MCAIVDRNAVGELLKQPHEAAKGFYKWLKKQGTLVVGGKELREAIYRRSDYKERQAVSELRSAGIIFEVEDSILEKQASELRKNNLCVSDDEHIIALAQISRARLLYSKDKDLHKDFDNKDLIDNPRGVVYSTLIDTSFSKDRRELLQRQVCVVGN